MKGVRVGVYSASFCVEWRPSGNILLLLAVVTEARLWSLVRDSALARFLPDQSPRPVPIKN